MSFSHCSVGHWKETFLSKPFIIVNSNDLVAFSVPRIRCHYPFYFPAILSNPCLSPLVKSLSQLTLIPCIQLCFHAQRKMIGKKGVASPAVLYQMLTVSSSITIISWLIALLVIRSYRTMRDLIEARLYHRRPCV